MVPLACEIRMVGTRGHIPAALSPVHVQMPGESLKYQFPDNDRE